MAKRKSATARALAPVVKLQVAGGARGGAMAPAFLGRTQAAMQKAGSRIGTKARQIAHDERHTLIALGSAAALGLAESRGVDLPKIDALGIAGTYGLGAYLYSKLTGSPTAEKVATGLLCVAIYKLTSAPAAGVSGGGKSGRV